MARLGFAITGHGRKDCNSEGEQQVLSHFAPTPALIVVNERAPVIGGRAPIRVCLPNCAEFIRPIQTRPDTVSGNFSRGLHTAQAAQECPMIRVLGSIVSFVRILVALGILGVSASIATDANAGLILNPGGQTVYDSSNGVVWLANGDLAATNLFGLPSCQTEAIPNSQPCVNTNGSMTYQSAQQWVQQMNAADYLGHHNWQLPVSPNTDGSCSSTGPMPAQNSFGFYCVGNGLGALYQELGLSAPQPVVLQQNNAVGQFINLQPGLYWSGTSSSNNANGFGSFSFQSGFEGSQVGDNFHFVLPMIPGPLPSGTPASVLAQTVYDPIANVTWLANGDLGATNSFGLPNCEQLIAAQPSLNLKDPVTCINADGSMNHESAAAWITAMNANGGYLGLTGWTLPPILPNDSNCNVPTPNSPNKPTADEVTGYNCTGGTPSGVILANPMGVLFYDVLGLSQGESVFGGPIADVVGPFTNLQSYLYWSCEGPSIVSECSGNPAAPGFQFSFFFGDGYQDTDIQANDLFVTAYYGVPESATVVLMGAGLLMLFGFGIKRGRADT